MKKISIDREDFDQVEGLAIKEDRMKTDELEEEFHDLDDKSPLSRIRWLSRNRQVDLGAWFDEWVMDEMERAEEDLSEDYEIKIKRELGADAEYYEELGHGIRDGARDMVEDVKKSIDEGEALDSAMQVIRETFAREVAEMKSEEDRYQKKYEEERDIVRHMHTPGDENNVEIPTDTQTLENNPYDGDIDRTSAVISELLKVAKTLKSKGLAEESSSILEVILPLFIESKFDIVEAVKLANDMDTSGNIKFATMIDKIVGL